MGIIDADRFFGQLILAVAVLLVMLSPIMFFAFLHAVVDRVRRWRGISSADRYTVLDWEDMCGDVIRKRDEEPPPRATILPFMRRRKRAN